MGKVRVRKETGRLYLDFHYRGVRCREYTALTDSRANRRRAERLLRTIEAQIHLGTFDYAETFPNSRRAAKFQANAARRPDPTGQSPNTPGVGTADTPAFEDFAEQWFRQSEVAWKASYRQKVRDILDGHLIPWIGRRPIEEISRSDVLDLRAYLARPAETRSALSPGRVNQIVAQLHHILADAAERFGTSNPTVGIKPLRETRPTVDPLSLEEVERFLGAVDPYYHDYFVVRFFTGLRTSEIDGLRWRYVDFEYTQIHVKEVLVKGKATTPKTPESERFVGLSSPVLAALRRQYRRTGDSLDSYVFQAPAGGPLHYRNVSNRVWYPTLQRLGIRRRRPYQTRHTAATLWLAAGESPEWIARQMGHTDTKMLFSRYSRYVPNLTRKDGSAIERILASHFSTQLHTSTEDPNDE